MQMFQKRSCKLMFNFDVYFRNIKVINYILLEKKYTNSVADMVHVSYTAHF